MPCRDYEDSCQTVYRDNPEHVRMLCDALSALNNANVTIPRSCNTWWAAHQREDLARQAAEKSIRDKIKKRKAILDKLSESDKKILGLK